MNKRYLVVDEQMGVFLGTHTPPSQTFEEPKSYALFASNDPFGLTEAYTFEKKEDAQDFIDRVNRSTIRYYEIDTKDEYVSLVDLIKAGYGEYTFDMISLLESPSEQLH